MPARAPFPVAGPAWMQGVRVYHGQICPEYGLETGYIGVSVLETDTRGKEFASLFGWMKHNFSKIFGISNPSHRRSFHGRPWLTVDGFRSYLIGARACNPSGPWAAQIPGSVLTSSPQTLSFDPTPEFFEVQSRYHSQPGMGNSSRVDPIQGSTLERRDQLLGFCSCCPAGERVELHCGIGTCHPQIERINPRDTAQCAHVHLRCGIRDGWHPFADLPVDSWVWPDGDESSGCHTS